ncbi:hypothetical protein AGR6A_pAt50094 [Agrobacterium sp. NCPPB 925]|nr:hypothetical protein AGR6A_pAt50094 [Agrobacterium sp. NCPPB 925]
MLFAVRPLIFGSIQRVCSDKECADKGPVASMFYDLNAALSDAKHGVELHLATTGLKCALMAVYGGNCLKYGVRGGDVLASTRNEHARSPNHGAPNHKY